MENERKIVHKLVFQIRSEIKIIDGKKTDNNRGKGKEKRLFWIKIRRKQEEISWGGSYELEMKK